LRKKECDANKENRAELAKIMPQIGALDTEEGKCLNNLEIARDKLQRAQDEANNPQQQLDEAVKDSTKLETELAANQK
jgi:hypothetical protein